MSGHSKWAQIKHKKSITDAKKAKAYTKIAALIAVAAREKGADPGSNPKLRLAIDKAKAVNMAQDKIERAINRGAGALGGEAIEEIILEAYGPGGTAILISALTDNRNRTVSEVRSILNEYGGKLAESGSVRWQFKEMRLAKFPADQWKENFELEAIDLGAEKVERQENEILIDFPTSAIESFRKFAEKNFGVPNIESEIDFVSSQPLAIGDEEKKNKLLALFDALDEQAEVDEIYSNAEFN